MRITKFIGNISLKAKAAWMGMTIFIGISIILFSGIFTLHQVEQEYKKVAETNYENIVLLEKVLTSIYKIQNHDLSLGLKKKETMKSEIKTLHTYIDQLNKTLPAQSKAQLLTLKKSLSAYKESIKQVKLSKPIVQKTFNLSEDSIKDLGTSLQSLESYIEANNLSSFYLLKVTSFRVLQIKQILTNSKGLLESLSKEIKEIKTRVTLKKLDKKRKIPLLKLLDNYHVQFSKITSLKQAFNTTQTQKSTDKNNTLTGLDKNISKAETVCNNLIALSYKAMNFEQANLHNKVEMTKKFFYIAAGVILFSLLFFGWVGKRLIGRLTADITKIKQNLEYFLDTCANMAKNSDELSTISYEQSTSIEQTSSSINEIGSMTTKTKDSAVDSQKMSKSNEQEAVKGKSAVSNALSAMNKLSDDSSHITKRFNQTSDELQDVVQIINQIGEKAKVINDIVFQTKLLSFNASVEAARAGEHGKGFSVVAEEIGNLASMSGNSAEEIRQILEQSIKKVTNIVENNEKDIGSLVKTNSSNIKHGIQTVQECETSLDRIMSNVEVIGRSIGEIASASQEQSSGIEDVSSAVNTLNITNTKTNQFITKSKVQAEEIQEKVESILNLISTLETNVSASKSNKKAA